MKTSLLKRIRHHSMLFIMSSFFRNLTTYPVHIPALFNLLAPGVSTPNYYPPEKRRKYIRSQSRPANTLIQNIRKAFGMENTNSANIKKFCNIPGSRNTSKIPFAKHT